MTQRITRMPTARLFLFCLGLLSLSPVQAQDRSPTETIEAMVNDVLAIVRSSDYNLQRDFSRIDAIVSDGFDSNTLAQNALGPSWRDLDNAQRAEFEQLFFTTLKNTYIERLDGYSGQTVEYAGEQIEGNRSTVDTFIVSGSSRIPVTYSLRQRPNGWFIFDVSVDGVSLLSSYRSTYRNIIRRSGVEGLLESMRESAG